MSKIPPVPPPADASTGQHPPDDNTGQTSSLGALVAVLGRLLWMFVGPLALTVLACSLALKSTGLFTVADAAYFGVLGAMLLGRWLEFRGGSPQTMTGERATDRDLRQYLLWAAILGFAVWVIIALVRMWW
jgi:hypothetical protein